MDRKPKEALPTDESALIDAVCGSAHQIWQAGLGAFARAQREGGDLFDKLVQEGAELQKLSQRLTGEKGFSVTDTVTRLAESASRQASGSLDKLEKMFEERVARSLRSLGLPSPDEVRALGRELDALKSALQAAERQARDDIDALRRALDRLERASAPGTPSRKAAVAPARKAGRTASKAAAGPAAKKAARTAAR